MSPSVTGSGTYGCSRLNETLAPILASSECLASREQEAPGTARREETSTKAEIVNHGRASDSRWSPAAQSARTPLCVAWAADISVSSPSTF